MKTLFRRVWPLALLPALLCRPACADTVVSNYATFKNALSSSATITSFVTNTTISLTSGGQTVDITGNVTIDGGTNGVVFAGNSGERLFNVHSNCQLVLKNVQVLNFSSTNGGAIYNQGTLIISNCIISGNAATNVSGANGANGSNGGDGGDGTSGGTAAGGAIYSTGPVRIYYSVLGTNTAGGGSGGSGGTGTAGVIFGGNGGSAGAGGGAYGAALYCTGTNNVFVATEFFDNVCTAGAAGSGGASGSGPFSGLGGRGAAGGSAEGGAVYLTGMLSATNCVFAQNTVTAGASGSDLSGNTGPNGGSAAGGGLYISSTAAGAYLENCVFFDNTCTSGAGGSGSAGDGSGGSALGGGLDSAAGLTWVRFCTLATNSLVAATGGGAAGFDLYRGGGVLRLSGSILSGDTNAVPNPKPNAYGVTDAGYNICSDASLTPVFTNTLIDTDPGLDSGLVDWGGPTLGPADVAGPPTVTLAILDSSPATNFVPGVPGLSFPATDELGSTRGSPASAGAYELNPIVLETNALLPTVSLETNYYYAAIGGTVVFQASAANRDTNGNALGYQWQLNGTNLSDNGTYSGTTTAHLTISNVTAAQAGTNYQLIVGVSTLEGIVTSAPISLIVRILPKITVQPLNKRNVPYGAAVTFSVGATGAPLSYQWFLNGVALNGATTSNLTINPVTFQDQGSYTVVVTNSEGTVTSAVAVLTVVADTAKPTVNISSPAANARTTNSVITGTASDNAQVHGIYYRITNVNAGITITQGTNILEASGATTKTWSITNALLPGTNYVTVQSVNYSTNKSAFVTREFFYVVQAPLTLNKSGNGTVTGAASVAGNAPPAKGALLNIGEGYTLTAKPAANYLLTNWTGSWTGVSGGVNTFSSNAPTLHFIMESNETITAAFTTNLFVGTRGTYNGLFYDSNKFTVQTAGMLSGLTVNTSGVYSGTLLLKGASLTLAPGSFDTSGHAINRVPRAAAQGGPVTVEMFLQWGDGLISGSVSGEDQGGWTNTLDAEKAAASSPSSAYTVLLGPQTNAVAEIPPGSGYMLITNHNGSVTLSGAVADGATFSQTVPLGVSSDVPVFYGKFYGNTGLLLGWLGLSNGTVEAETPMAWIRPAAWSGLYTNGFTNLLSVTGSGWTNPPSGTPALSLSGGALTIADGSLSLDFDVSITNNTVVKKSGSTNSMTGTIAPKTGLLQITFGNGTGKATTVGYGALLQNSNKGGGYFVTKTNAGFIQLLPP